MHYYSCLPVYTQPITFNPGECRRLALIKTMFKRTAPDGLNKKMIFPGKIW